MVGHGTENTPRKGIYELRNQRLGRWGMLSPKRTPFPKGYKEYLARKLIEG